MYYVFAAITFGGYGTPNCNDPDEKFLAVLSQEDLGKLIQFRKDDGDFYDEGVIKDDLGLNVPNDVLQVLGNAMHEYDSKTHKYLFSIRQLDETLAEVNEKRSGTLVDMPQLEDSFSAVFRFPKKPTDEQLKKAGGRTAKRLAELEGDDDEDGWV